MNKHKHKRAYLTLSISLAALAGCITPQGYDRPDAGGVSATGGVGAQAGASGAGTGGNPGQVGSGGHTGTGGAIITGTGGANPGTGGTVVVGGTGGTKATPPPGTVLYQDDFQSDTVGSNAKNWIQDTIDSDLTDGPWTVVANGTNQVLQGAATGSDFTMDIGGDVTWTDYTFQVDITMISGSSYEFGVFGRFSAGTDKDNYYEVYMDDSGGVQLRVRNNGSTTTVGSKSKSTTGDAQLNTLYTFVLDMHGSTFNVSVNGTPRISMAMDTTLTTGGIGLIVNNGTAQFDNVYVTE
jgi:hypothetical protein